MDNAAEIQEAGKRARRVRNESRQGSPGRADLPGEPGRAPVTTPGDRATRLVEFARLEVAGYLGRDAQVVRTSEREFVALNVGSSRTWRGPDQQLQERTVWTKVLVFGERGDALRELKKGAPIYANGPLTYDRWEDAHGPRHTPVIRVTERVGDVQAGPMPGGQFTRVTLAGVITRAATVQRAAGEDANRSTARFGVQARGDKHAVLVQGPLVNHVAERLGAGHGVRMEGRLELHRWQDGDGRSHERATIVIGGPDSQIRVDRQPTMTPALGPEAKPVATPDLSAPAPMRAPDRADRARM